MLDGRRFSPVYSDHDRSQSPTSSALPKEVVNDSSLSTRTRQQGEDFPPSVEADNDDDEDVYGPTLPSAEGTAIAPARHAGPSNPTLQDIRMKHEEERYEREAAYEARQRTLAAERKAHKLEAKQLQEDIVPRAEPGTRERRLEKKREAAALNRAFAESRRGGSPGAEIGDEVLMGGGARSDLVWLKKERERMERKKNERELRREEILKARMAERAERLKNYRQREEQTISMFRTLAQQRFGTSGE
ncbi:hypothetical protein KEM54_003532 [Ascosphaera aggregata]|nr:hypothetical protein KEM54_003532 [Ascosphaera aggregata]